MFYNLSQKVEKIKWHYQNCKNSSNRAVIKYGCFSVSAAEYNDILDAYDRTNEIINRTVYIEYLYEGIFSVCIFF